MNFIKIENVEGGRFGARMEWGRIKSALHGHSEYEASAEQTRGVPKICGFTSWISGGESGL